MLLNTATERNIKDSISLEEEMDKVQ
jgi:hypothetical protein